jgi:hypothetical protein
VSLRTPCDERHDRVSPSRLDEGTQLVGTNWWPEAGEATTFFARAPRPPGDLEDDLGAPAREGAEDEASRSPESVGEDRRVPSPSENRERAARRARGRLRRYVVTNALTRMVSLTFAPNARASKWEPSCGRVEPSPSGEGRPQEGGRCSCGRPRGPLGLLVAMRDVGRFVRALRDHLGVDRLPYAVVPEFHKDGHVHLHLLVDRYVPKDELQALWRRGWVDVRRFEAKGEGGRAAARKAAAYAGKYVGKTFEVEGVPGRHRYEVAEGFQPSVIKRRGWHRSLAEAVDDLADGHGQAVVFAVHSDGLEDYDGPAFLWVALEEQR